jgi:hypothetical protein
VQKEKEKEKDRLLLKQRQRQESLKTKSEEQRLLMAIRKEAEKKDHEFERIPEIAQRTDTVLTGIYIHLIMFFTMVLTN